MNRQKRKLNYGKQKQVGFHGWYNFVEKVFLRKKKKGRERHGAEGKSGLSQKNHFSLFGFLKSILFRPEAKAKAMASLI